DLAQPLRRAALVRERGTALTGRLGRDVALVVALLAPLLVALLWWPPIGEHGEAREGLVVQHIVTHGGWILPRRNSQLPSKPPLFHWLPAPLRPPLSRSPPPPPP